MIRLSNKLKKDGNKAPPKPTFIMRDKLLSKEIQEIQNNLPVGCQLSFPNSNELHKIHLQIKPEEGFWRNGTFKFTIDVPLEYNFSPPKVKCLTRIYHPNISEEGDICLSLLRESSIDGMGWAPTRTIKDVVWGLNSLFTDLLNFEDSLNHTAAEHYHKDPSGFQTKVKEYVSKYA